MPVLIEARAISHRYGDHVALNGFDLDVPEGAVFGLLGPNGSGKSTFLSLVAGMESPQAGTLRIFDSAPASALRARIGCVFQENAQDPLMSPSEMLALAARLFGVERATARARSASLLERLGLADRANDAISTLSGGMRRRLEMARALVHDPELLLLDEPTTGVDAGERMAVWQALRESRDGPAVGRTTLLASNDLAEADTVCDLVAFMGSGRIVATGTPHELKRELRRDSVRLTWAASANDLSTVRAWPGVGEVARDGDSVRLTADDASALVPRLFELAPGVIRGVTIEPATLEDAYFQHVGGRRTAVAGELR